MRRSDGGSRIFTNTNIDLGGKMNAYCAIDNKEPNIHSQGNMTLNLGIQQKNFPVKVHHRNGDLLIVLFGLITVLLFSSMLDKGAFAATYYVDGSCTNNGNGLADQCAASTGGAGAWKDPQSGFSAAVAGDTVLIKNGTYLDSTPGRYGGFTIGNSGTSGNPITFKNYPDHSPILRNCNVSSTWCDHPTISADNKHDIVIDGLTVHGAIHIFCAQFGSYGEGVVIRNNNIDEGWEYVSDGNWAPLRLENCIGAQVDHNYIHDTLDIGSLYGASPNRTSGIVYFQVHNSITEYNLIESIFSGAGINDKAESQNNIHRYNLLHNIDRQCFFINNQLSGVNISIYGNICNGFGWGVQLVTSLNGGSIYNNTFYGGSVCLYSEGPSVSTINFYNNICYLSSSGGENGNFVVYQNSILLNVSNYNRFTSGKSYRPDLSHGYSSLASYQSGYGKDTNSAEETCTFVNPGVDFHIASGSCKNGGRVGGVSSGSTVDVGAYGIASCVGNSGCIPNSPPSAPTNLIAN